jgi:mannosyltransferase OCH1-like enzyme
MWRKHNPKDQFEYKLWTEDDLPALAPHLQNKDVIFDKNLNPALRADFLRLELLF